MTERRDDDPVSLAPLTAEEALRALLAVDPDAEPADEQVAGPEDEAGSVDAEG